MKADPSYLNGEEIQAVMVGVSTLQLYTEKFNVSIQSSILVDDGGEWIKIGTRPPDFWENGEWILTVLSTIGTNIVNAAIKDESLVLTFSSKVKIEIDVRVSGYENIVISGSDFMVEIL